MSDDVIAAALTGQSPDWRAVAAMLAWSMTGDPHTELQQQALDLYDRAVQLEQIDGSAP